MSKRSYRQLFGGSSFKRMMFYAGGAVVFGVVGVWLLTAAHASTTTASIEAENGTLSSCASVVGDSSASGGKAVKFCSGGFAHPGILFNTTQLNFIKAKVAGGQQPWTAAYNKALTNWNASKTFPTDKARADVDCGYSSNPDNGCTDETAAAQAAYTQALLWYITGNTQYSQKAIAILNNWSSTLQKHTNANAPIQTAWTAEMMVPAAEIIRYTDAGWSASDVQSFSNMLSRAFVPEVDQTWPGGGANWLMSMIDATMDIAVFQNDQPMFARAVTRWRQQVPSIIYLSTDTNDAYTNLKGKGYPIPPPGISWVNANVSTNTMNVYWYNPSAYVSGLEGETCRDMDHTTMGFEGLFHGAQTAYIQGVDLYSEEKNRIVTGMEFNTRYMAQQLSTGSVPANVCGGKINKQTYPAYNAGWELGYAHYHDKLGASLPYTKAFIDTYVRSGNAAIYTQLSGLPTLSFAQSN